MTLPITRHLLVHLFGPSRVAVACLVAGICLGGLVTEAAAQWGWGGGWNRGLMVPRQMAPPRAPRSMPTGQMSQHKWELPRPVGVIVARPPDGAMAMKIGEQTYFCHGPDFYLRTRDGFMVTVPPLGGSMNRAPLGSERMQVNGRDYFYYNGAFVTRGADGFEVVSAPVGTVVYRIPQAHQKVTIGGKSYAVVGGTYFKRVFRAGNAAYRVAPPPSRVESKPPGDGPPAQAPAGKDTAGKDTARKDTARKPG